MFIALGLLKGGYHSFIANNNRIGLEDHSVGTVLAIHACRPDLDTNNQLKKLSRSGNPGAGEAATVDPWDALASQTSEPRSLRPSIESPYLKEEQHKTKVDIPEPKPHHSVFSGFHLHTCV